MSNLIQVLPLIAQFVGGPGVPGLVQLLIVCIIVGAILYVASLVAGYLGAPPFLMRIVYVIVCVIVCIYAIRILASLL